MADLFAAAAEERLRTTAPLAARLRPRTIDDVVGQEHLVGPGKPLRRLVEQDRLSSAIFWGPPGTGKTTLALAVAGTTARAFEQMSAVTAGVKDVREVIERARHRLGERDQGTILFLDEIHRFSKAQQDALLPAVEDGTLTLIGATTENPFFEVNPPLRSRSTLFRLEPLDAGGDARRSPGAGSRPSGTTASPEAIDLLVDRAGGDGRQVLTSLEVAVRARPSRARSARPRRGGARHERAALRARRPLRRDQRVHQVDARLRSRRRGLLAGADARGRRGRPVHRPADGDLRQRGRRDGRPAGAARRRRRGPCASSTSGCPEAQLNLAQAVIHLATAPKSNRAALAIWNAREDVRDGAVGEVPAHLRDAHYQGAAVDRPRRRLRVPS